MALDLICIESQLICILLLAVVCGFYFKLEQKEQKEILFLSLLAIFAVVMNIIRCCTEGKPDLVLLLHISHVCYLCSLGGIGVCWLYYCAKCDHIRLHVVWSLLPAVTVAGMALFPNGIYQVTPEGYIRTGSYSFVLLIDYIYFFLPLKWENAWRKNAVVSSGKRASNLSFWVLLMMLACGIMEWWLLPEGLALMPYAILFCILILLFQTQYQKIRTDRLTNLMNRYGMDDEISEQLRQYQKDHSDSFYLIACDLDNFKQINDTWGHQEGDRALMLISDVLSGITQQYDSKVFRIGGDEFVIIVDTAEECLVTEICKQIEENLQCVHFRDDFDIKMSIGIAKYDGVTDVNNLFRRADMKMYELKKQRKQETASDTETSSFR